MSREKLNKKQLNEKKVQLEQEIKTLKDVIDASNSPLFDMLVKEIKKDMENNIAEEDWKSLKQNQKKIESYRDVERIIQNQTDLLERKEEELEDVTLQLDNYQQDLFEDSDTDGTGLIDTGITNNAGQEFSTGDVYESLYKNANTNEYEYYLIKKSSEKENEFAIIGNHLKEELLLQYPKNKELLNTTNAAYVGNIYIEDDDQNAAMEIAKLIADSIENVEGIEDSDN